MHPTLLIKSRKAALNNEEKCDIEEIAENFAKYRKVATLEVRSKNENSHYNFSSEAKLLMKKRRSTKNTVSQWQNASSITYQNYKKEKQEDFRKFNMRKINEAQTSGKTARRVKKRKLV